MIYMIYLPFLTHFFEHFVKVETQIGLENFVDHQLSGSFTVEGMKELLRLILLCTSCPGKVRPKMEMVSFELERILEKEMAMTSVMGEGTTTITLGSELFTAYQREA